MNQAGQVFRKPNFFEQILNKGFGVLVGLGIGLRHNYLLQVAGRTTGRVYSTPIDLLEFKEDASSSNDSDAVLLSCNPSF